MAWHDGQPVYGSNPVSSFIRENFAYLKQYIDYITGSGVTQADLLKLHQFTLTAAEANALHLSGLTAAELVALAGLNIDAAVTAGLTAADLVALAAITATAAQINNICSASFIKGYVQRPKFRYISGTSLGIGPGVYHHSGTTEQIVFWNAELTKTVGTLVNSTYYYVYINDAAVVALGSNELTATEISVTTTAPAWDSTKHGWYSGSNRCIFAFRTVGTTLPIFRHDGGDYVQHEDYVTCGGYGLAPGSETQTFTLYLPSFATKANVLLWAYNASDAGYIRIGPSSSELCINMRVADSGDAGEQIWTQLITEILTNSSGQLYVESTWASAGSFECRVIGFYLPTGM